MLTGALCQNLRIRNLITNRQAVCIQGGAGSVRNMNNKVKGPDYFIIRPCVFLE